jgi:hypothetical protein
VISDMQIPYSISHSEEVDLLKISFLSSKNL